MSTEQNQVNDQGDNHGQFKLVIDQQHYSWPHNIITAEQIRQLASIPATEDIELFHKVPGKGDVAVPPDSIVNLDVTHGTDHFSSSPKGSRAGA